MTTSRLIAKFNKKTEAWLTELKNTDADLLLVKPSEKIWSLAEVYDHVMRVTRSYQIPNLKKSLTGEANRKKRKNIYGLAVFNLRYRKNVKMQLEKWPTKTVNDFTPVRRPKTELVEDFTNFRTEVNELEALLNKSSNKDKQYHPFFGDISTKEWFALIELHIWQHDKQKEKIKALLKNRQV
jgi:hypothetical protein